MDLNAAEIRIATLERNLNVLMKAHDATLKENAHLKAILGQDLLRGPQEFVIASESFLSQAGNTETFEVLQASSPERRRRCMRCCVVS